MTETGNDPDRAKPDLVAVVRAVADGNRADFAYLYDTFSPMVHGMAMRMLRDDARAAEATTVAMLALWRESAGYVPARGSVQAWVAATANRVARRQLDAGRDLEADAGRGLETDDGCPEGGLLAILPPEQREAVCGAYFGGRTYSRLAAERGERPAATLKTLSAAMRALGARRTEQAGQVGAAHRADKNVPAPDVARSLLAAWALGAVDDAERSFVEQAIHDRPALAGEARAHVETAAVIALQAAAPPPEQLRTEVLEAVVPKEAGLRALAALLTKKVTVRVGVLGWIVIAAVLTIAALAPAVITVQQTGKATRTAAELARFAEILADPTSRFLTADLTGGGHAAAVLSRSGSLFTATELPALGDQQDYQLWVLEAGSAESLGVLEVAGGDARTLLEDASLNDTLALTVEPAGGSAQPTAEPLATLPESAPAAE